MDVDCDVDQDLMMKFSNLGTTDREVLINELQRLLDFQLNQAGCAFFLDMSNWNLQAAVCAYYDFNSPNDKLPSMSFVKDVTIGEGESVPPCSTFVKTWRLQNSGPGRWPSGVFLKFTSGDQLGPIKSVEVQSLAPGEAADVSVNMISPNTPGMYQGQWRMCTPTGSYFGDVIWVIICVDEGGLLAVTQQLSHLGQEFSPVNPPSGSPVNPFGLLPTTPNGNSPQPTYTVPHNSPSSLLGSPIRRSLFNNSNEVVDHPCTRSPFCGKDEEILATQLDQPSLRQPHNQWDCSQL
ncbi:protein ILRUN-like [Actinia tenebrosa]|uniref:Protein ILRUN n=1 Tax=Actinia tenebrosa TaxID=6105 RepID=A0A6P8HAW1_ACTTE|nr:protein ILRUN-like [Actinia tenebrosa]